MTAFNELCREFEEMGAEEYTQTVKDLSGDILPVLDEYAKDGQSGIDIFRKFILASVVADGKLAEEEYLMAVPLFQEFFGGYISYNECCEYIKKCKEDNRELLTYTNYMVDLFSLMDDYVKDDIITVCLLICAIDGTVSAKEKRWIKQLMK